MDQGLGKSEYNHCFQIFFLSFPYFGGVRIGIKEEAIPSLPTTPIFRNGKRPPSIKPGSQYGRYSKGAAQVALITKNISK